jgi:hypothetical protein
MSNESKDLGRIVAVHGVSPAYLQRAVFIVILSFLFFLGMMVAFYIIQNFIYFLLASAFLVVYLVTLFSWVSQRRNVVKIYEHGVEYRKFSCRWNEIEAVTDSGDDRSKLDITTKAGGKITLSDTIIGLDQIASFIRAKIAADY